MRVLVSGGAGFVGSRIALDFRGRGAEVVAFDNLRRRGSETNIAPLSAATMLQLLAGTEPAASLPPPRVMVRESSRSLPRA